MANTVIFLLIVVLLAPFRPGGRRRPDQPILMAHPTRYNAKQDTKVPKSAHFGCFHGVSFRLPALHSVGRFVLLHILLHYRGGSGVRPGPLFGVDGSVYGSVAVWPFSKQPFLACKSPSHGFSVYLWNHGRLASYWA